MDELEKVYRWRKKEGTGKHYFQYQGKRHRIGPGNYAVCPMRFVNPCIEQYECIGVIGEGGEVLPVDIDAIQNGDQKQEEDIKLEVVALGRGWYDVINPENPDKPINDKALRRDDAYSLAGIDDNDIDE